MHKRKDINSLSAAELDAYLHALNILRRRSQTNPDDKTGYDYQARLHNDMEVGPCEHGNDLFFPWHRCHLYHFEKLLQASDPPVTSNVTIPYWDWSRVDPNGGRYPAAFSRPELVAPRFPTGAPLETDTLQIVKDKRDWNEFAGWPRGTPGHDYGAFEDGPHNYTHGDYIGGLMGNPETAAEDPIYFSFHCFIDLLWAEWSRRNPDKPITSAEALLRGFADQSLNRVKHFGRTQELGYEYEYNAALAADLAELSPAPAALQPFAAPTASPLFEGSIGREFLTKASASFALPSVQPAKRLVAVLNSLSITKVASFTLRAYLHPRSTPVDDKTHYVGYASIWKAHAHAGHHGHGGHGAQHPTSAAIRLDITDVYRRLVAAQASDLVLTLKFHAAPLPSGEPAPVEPLTSEIALADVHLEAST